MNYCDNLLRHYCDIYCDIFWEELIDSLGRRDFIKEYGRDAVGKMTWEERIEKEQPFIEKYAEEFERYGIENLEIKR